MQPFAGIRVLDLSQTRVGAQASQLFADFGAEVVMVEPPGGLELREHAAFPFWARGKKSVVLDMHAEVDRAEILRLARGADLVVEDFRHGTLDDLGLGYKDMRQGNPGLVYCAITGFGPQGPYADAPAQEGLALAKLGVFQSFARIGTDPSRPAFVTAPYTSWAACQVALHAVLAALHERETSGLGQKVEANLAQSFLAIDTWSWIEHVLATRWPDALKAYTNFDAQGRPLSHMIFRLLVAMSADGAWMQFAATAPKLYAALMKALGLDGLFNDPQWAGIPAFEDPDKGMELWNLMLSAVHARSSAEWDHVFDTDSNVSGEHFRAGADILEHPQLLHDAMTVTLADPERGPVRQPGPLVKASGAPTKLRHAPRLDADRALLLKDGWSAPRLKLPAPSAPVPKGLPLAGVTILELATMFAAPQGPALLTELGARVIKVEPLEGDPIRHLITLPETGGTRAMQGKDSICIDLAKPEGIEIVRRLAAKADVVVQGFRAGVVKRIGLDYEALKSVNPDIIYVNAPGYGVDGPYGRRPAYAPSIGAAVGFALTNLGLSGHEPVREMDMAAMQDMARRLSWASTHTTAQADGVAAVGVGTAIAFGLYARDRGSGGQELFTSMLNSGVHMMSSHAVNWPGQPPTRLVDAEFRGLGALYRIYDAAEGYVFLAAPSQEDWLRLCDAMAGEIDLASNPSFADRASRERNDAALAESLTDVFKRRPAQAWERDLLARNIGCVQVTTTSTEALLLDTPLGRESGYVTEVVDPTWGDTPRQAPLTRLSRSATQAPPPCLAGQHTDDILAEFGLGEEIARLRDQEVVA